MIEYHNKITALYSRLSVGDEDRDGGEIVGGVYDDRFLVKPVKSAIAYMPNAKYELP